MGSQEHLHRGETASARMLPGTDPNEGVAQNVAESPEVQHHRELEARSIGGPLSPG